MKSFSYKIKDEIGLHARPAGMLTKEAQECTSHITITNMENQKSADAGRIMSVMGLSVKCGNTVRIDAEGENEEADIARIERFFQENL